MESHYIQSPPSIKKLDSSTIETALLWLHFTEICIQLFCRSLQQCLPPTTKSTTYVHIEFQNFLSYTYILKEASSYGSPMEDLKVLKSALTCASSNNDLQF